MIQGIFSFLIFLADVWAILNIAQSSVSNGKKVLWVVAVLLLPVLGFVVWYFMGPRGNSRSV